ncbi:hypothetical protein [Pseudomonas nicosulfuronedens]
MTSRHSPFPFKPRQLRNAIVLLLALGGAAPMLAEDGAPELCKAVRIALTQLEKTAPLKQQPKQRQSA